MRKLLVILLSLSPALLFAQHDVINLQGSFDVTGGNTYSYQLHLIVNGYSITGYSITGINDSDETKTAVTGSITASQKKITLKETHLLYTKSHAPKEDFCFMTTDLTISKNKKATGPFTGYLEDGKTLCATGTMNLTSANGSLKHLFEKSAPAPPDPAGIVPVKAPELHGVDTSHPAKLAQPPQNSNLQINPGETKILPCDDSDVRIAIWDNKNIDGDIITVLFNDKILLSNYTITRAPADLHVVIHKNDRNILRIVCVSEGTEPTNTARMYISSGNRMYTVDAVTKMDKDVFIELHQQ